MLQPIVMVAWSCFYSTAQVNISDAKHWIKENAMRGPASHVSENGHYNDGLIKAAKTISDKHDTDLCPDKIKVGGIIPIIIFLPLLQGWKPYFNRTHY